MHTFYAGLAALPDSWLYVVEPASLEVYLFSKIQGENQFKFKHKKLKSTKKIVLG